MKPSTYVRPWPVLVLASTCLLSCGESEHVKTLRNQIVSLKQETAKSQREIDDVRTKIATLSKERDGLKGDRDKLLLDIETARTTLGQVQKDFAAYRSQYKISMRSRAPGMSLGALVINGKSYQNVKVREAAEDMLTVYHDTGTQRFAWESVPDNVRRLFGHEKPGEHVMISFINGSANGQPLSREEIITRHDAQMVELRRKIGELQTEVTSLGRFEQEIRVALSQSVSKKLDNVNLQRVANTYAVKRIQLEADIRKHQKMQDNLMKQDPRKGSSSGGQMPPPLAVPDPAEIGIKNTPPAASAVPDPKDLNKPN